MVKKAKNILHFISLLLIKSRSLFMKKAIILAIVMILSISSMLADDWTPITPPGAPSARHGHSMVTMSDGTVYLFAGEGAYEDLFNDLFVFENNDWAEITPVNPPPARRDHQAWARSDVMYVYGGYGENGALDDMWSYNTTENTWQQEVITGPRPQARYGQTVTTMTDGSEIIVGGIDANGDPLDDCWKLNPDNTFTQLQDAPYAYSEHSTALSTDGEWLYVFGKPYSLGIYRVSIDRWSLVSGGPPNGPGCCTTRGVNAAGEPVVFIFGGKDFYGNEMNQSWEYNLYGGELSQRGDMPQPIVNGAAAKLPVIPPSFKHSLPLGWTVKSSRQQFENNWLEFGGLSDSIPTNNSYTFTPISPPDTITVVAPLDSVFADSVLMRWNPAEPWQATHYQVQVAIDSAMSILFADTVVTDTLYMLRNLSNNTDYWWQVRGYNAGGWGPFNTPVHFFVSYVVSVDDDPHLKKFYLHQNNPNPFNSSTTISFSLPEASKVDFSVYNLKGQKVKTLADGNLRIGDHKIVWNGKDENDKPAPSGVYFYKMEAGNYSEIRKCILLK
ncbi:MAG: T9SS C-terminal target domain-containing protein [Planctomycetaceae bacterium]|nr:MAG: T9SS C-terminal target domain-containing protein [Planctomycetaceae bacterium]